MSIHAYITIAILALTLGLLIKTKIPPVAVFVGALTLTIAFQLAPLEESLEGFSNRGVLTIGALFMVAAGMYSTGAITMITDKFRGRPIDGPIHNVEIRAGDIAVLEINDSFFYINRNEVEFAVTKRITASSPDIS
jgi:hypothetical protein